MRLLFFFALYLCALIIDYQIYRRIYRNTERRPKRRWLRPLFLIYAVTINIFIFTFIIFGYHWFFYGLHVAPLPLWLTWIFFFNAIPKCVYVLLYPLSRRLSIALASIAAFILIKGAFYNIHRIEVKYVTIESKKIPPSFDGYRMALFSDVHLGNLSQQKKFLNRAVNQINELQPDIIFQTGDLINIHTAEVSPSVQAIFSKFLAPDGVYGVLGNHDMGAYLGRRAKKSGYTPLENTRLLLLRQKDMGWIILQNESLQIGRGADSIGLCGVPYPPLPPRFPDSLTHFDPQLATSLLDTTRFNIMLCHTPLVWETLQDDPAFKRVDLILSGHSHAMQAKVEIGSWQWSPARIIYRYWSGLYEHDNRYLYVNQGLGYVVYPMRIGCKPEITLFTLKRKQ